ncbi:MAG: FmdB family zinc ribbon protein [Candidatus Binatia bacterium]
MPIYEYQCTKCGTFELSQRITDSPLRRCPSCKGKVTKLISQTSFQLKGSGWYLTDYASKGNGKKDAAEGKKPEAATAPESASPGAASDKNDSGKPASPSAGSAKPPPAKGSSAKSEATAA